MAKKKDPAAEAVAFFETAPIDVALAVLGICKGILTRRQPAKAKPRSGKTSTARAVADGSAEQSSP